MRRFPFIVLILVAVFTALGISESSAVNETRITSVTVSGLATSVSWTTDEKQKKTTYQVELTDKSKKKNNVTVFKTSASTLELRDLKAWNQYSVRIRAVVGVRSYSWSKPKTFSSTQNAVTDLVANSISYRSATLNWTSVSGATAYKVYVNGQAVSVVPVTSYEMKNLSLGKEYSYAIAPMNGTSQGVETEPQVFTTLNSGPKILTNTVVTNTTAKFEWSSIPGVDDYEVFADDKLVERTKSTNYEFKSLTPGQVLVVKVQGRFGEQITESIVSKIVIKKEVPSNLKMIEATSSTLKFEWTGSANFTKYYVYLDGLRHATTTSTSYTFSDLKRGQSVSVYVTGVEKEVESGASEVIKANTLVVTPNAPTVSVLGAVSANITWTQDLAAKNFIINVYDGISATPVKTNTVIGTATSTVISGLLANSSYTATLTIDYGTLTTNPSIATSFTTLKPTPTGSTISGITTTGATLTWDLVLGADIYETSRDGGAATSAGTTGSVAFSSLSPGVTYSVRIRAGFLDSGKNRIYSDWSTAVSFTTTTDPANKPTNSSVPAITVSSPTSVTTAVVGATLSASTGGWTSTPAVSGYTYQWQRSLDGGTVWSNLDGATRSTYVVVDSDFGFKLRVNVTATNTNGSTVASSTATDAITTVVNLQIPIVRGTLVVGQILTATQGIWYSASTLSYSYQWQSSSNNASWSNITDETSGTYTLASGDVTKYIRVQVTARSNLGSSTATSSVRGTVGALLNTALPTISGVARVTETLTATSGTWLNSPGSYSYRWEESSDNLLWDSISGATSSTFSLTASQAGKYVRVQVKGIKTISATDYSEVVYSTGTTAVTGLVITNTLAPVVSGAWTVGTSISTSSGTWSTSGSYTYKWQRSSDASSWSDISGATSSSYTLTSDDSGKFVRSVVTITSSTGAGTAYSASTRKVGAPYNTVVPVVSGTVRVGSTQTTTDGTWSNTPTSITYQWQTSSNGILWTNVGSATNSTYTPTFAQANLQLRVQISAVNAVDTATVTSNVVSGFLPPEATVIPTISGTKTVGETLTATSGTWPNTDSGYAYQWQRSTDGVTWSNISSATSSTYVLVTADAGYVIRVQVSLSTNAGTSVAYSLATTSVAAS